MKAILGFIVVAAYVVILWNGLAALGYIFLCTSLGKFLFNTWPGLFIWASRPQETMRTAKSMGGKLLNHLKWCGIGIVVLVLISFL